MIVTLLLLLGIVTSGPDSPTGQQPQLAPCECELQTTVDDGHIRTRRCIGWNYFVVERRIEPGVWQMIGSIMAGGSETDGVGGRIPYHWISQDGKRIGVEWALARACDMLRNPEVPVVVVPCSDW